MRLKHFSLFLTALLLAVFSFSILAATKLPVPKTSTVPLDQIVAVVNDGVITQTEVDAAYQRAKKQIAKSGKPVPNASLLKNEILNQLIYRKLQFQLATRGGLKVSNKQVDTAIKSIAKQHKITAKQLRKKVESRNFTYAQYRKEVKRQILLTMLQHQVLGKKLEVTNKEVDAFLAKYKSQGKFATHYHLVDFLIPLPATPTSTQSKQAKALALKTFKNLPKGIDHFNPAGIKVTDMGWRTAASLPDLFTHNLTSTKVGGLIGPLRAQNGYHIIKLKGIRKGSSDAPTKTQVRQLLMQQKLGKNLKKWLEKLRKNASVKIIVPQ